MEILIITFLDAIGKNSEQKSFGSGLATSKTKIKDLKFTDKLMVERLSKCKGEALLLKGLQFFLTDKVQTSGLTRGKKQKARVAWGVESMCDIISGLLESTD
ncbi:unnamed protein product [Ambrosiozyma monospora]|nr:unnamed protein product [Ambrosiozyma monospora]